MYFYGAITIKAQCFALQTISSVNSGATLRIFSECSRDFADTGVSTGKIHIVNEAASGTMLTVKGSGSWGEAQKAT